MSAPVTPNYPTQENPMTNKTTAVDDLAVWIAAYREATATAKQWQETADRAKEHITATLAANDAEIGTIGGRPAVRYTTIETTRLDTKKLRAEHPDLVEQFSVPTSSRRFTLVTGKGQ